MAGRFRRRRASLRPAGFDELGLRRALSDRMLPFLVAAMAFLAALALAGAVGAASLARHWREGAGASLTVQVPRGEAPASGQGGTNGDTRLAAVVALLRGTPGVREARALSDDELAELLRPWLGSGVERLSLPLPAVVRVRLADAARLGGSRRVWRRWRPAHWWRVTASGSAGSPRWHAACKPAPA